MGGTPPPMYVMYEEPGFDQSTPNDMKFVQVIENSLKSENIEKVTKGQNNDTSSLGGDTEESFHSIKSEDLSSIANVETKDGDQESISDFKSLQHID